MSALKCFFATCVYLRGNLRVRLATQCKSLRKFNFVHLRVLAVRLTRALAFITDSRWAQKKTRPDRFAYSSVSRSPNFFLPCQEPIRRLRFSWMTGRWPIKIRDWVLLINQDFYIRLVDDKNEGNNSVLVGLPSLKHSPSSRGNFDPFPPPPTACCRGYLWLHFL